MHDETTITAFTAQAEGFNASAAANHAGVLDAIEHLAMLGSDERWVEAACGPGVVSRSLAPHVAEIHGYDMTPTMIELARREAAAAGLTNAAFDVADAAALPLAEGSVDGAAIRFAFHHIPAPVRVLRELGRAVGPGGKIVVADHLLDADPDAGAWAQEIERLRDPSHWASLTLSRLHAIVAEAGLTIDEELVIGLDLHFEDWLQRGGPDADTVAIIEELVAAPPPHVASFRITGEAPQRGLHLQMWAARLRHPS